MKKHFSIQCLKNEKGFTLAEVMIAVTIVAIMSIGVFVIVNGAIDRAEESRVLNLASNAFTAAQILAHDDFIYEENKVATYTSDDWKTAIGDFNEQQDMYGDSEFVIDVEGTTGKITKFEFTDGKTGITIPLNTKTGKLKRPSDPSEETE